MGRNAKVGIAGAVVLILAAITLAMGQQIFTIAIVVIGGAGIFLLLRQDDEGDDGGGRSRAPKAKKGKARLDEILDDKAKGGTTTARRPQTPAAPPSGGLPTWSPGSVDSGALDEVDEPAASSDDWDSWDKEWPGDDAETLVLDDDPLSSLDRLDDIDPVAEVERIEAAADDDPFASLRSDLSSDDTFELDELEELEVGLDDSPAPSSGGGFSFSSATLINEEVSTADDIMAASTATELHVDEAGDSELARLLAKVQARLSAYE